MDRVVGVRVPVISEDDAVRRAQVLAEQGGRRLLGVAGPPGAGKSTLAAGLAAALGPLAVLVPMDGFHLASNQLHRLGLADWKGAPETFDAAGLVALLRRLRSTEDEVVYAPTFDRDLEEPIAGAIAVPRTVPLVVIEGNYLLHDPAVDGRSDDLRPDHELAGGAPAGVRDRGVGIDLRQAGEPVPGRQPWGQLRPLLDECWFVDLDPVERVRRLVARHVRHGRSREAATEWVLRSDERNAALIELGRERADLVVAR